MKKNHKQPRQHKKETTTTKPKPEVGVTKHKPFLKCISSSVFVLTILLFVGIEIPLIWFVWKYYIWVIPLVLFINTFLIWLIVNRLLFRVLLFPFSLTIIKNYNTFKLNQTYCDEILTITKTCAKAMTTCMIGAEHKKDTSYADYKHFSSSLHRFVELIETFLPVNQSLAQNRFSR